MDSKSLLCDEELLISPPTLYLTRMKPSLEVLVGTSYYPSGEDRDRALGICMERETCHMPQDGYVDHLLSTPELVAARFRVVRWMIKTRCRLNLLLGAVFDAMNYFDRYISLSLCKELKYWVIDLLSIACLSLAAKSYEVSIPSLSDFQVDNLDHSFQPSEIQEMELKVMKALGWRLSCITAYSYVDLLTWNLGSLHVGLSALVTELLVATLLDPKFITFRPCTVAVAALRCSLEELLPSKSATHLSDLVPILSVDQMAEMNKCHVIMEECIADPLYSLKSNDPPYFPSSPVTVLVADGIPTVKLRPSNPKKRKKSGCASDGV
ncbi:hypothetical protein AAC387_Pa05g3820 [Persea americana]